MTDDCDKSKAEEIRIKRQVLAKLDAITDSPFLPPEFVVAFMQGLKADELRHKLQECD